MKKSLIVFLIFSFLLIQTPACQIQTKKPSKPKAFTPSGKEVKVDALYFKQTPEGPSGGTATVMVKAKANKTKKLRVGFFEEEVAGSGPMWRSAGWMATTIGTLLLGLDLVDYHFTFDVSGYVDGPSAGGLMTVAVLSSLLGDEVKKEVAMTGTINPDGAIGPVGGIPQKIEGAKDAKKKLVLIPAGQRYSFDLKTSKVVDVVEFGRKKGVRVKEVSDIHQAYKYLTGKELPRPKVSDEKPELSSRTYDKIKAKSSDWFSRYSKISLDYASIDSRYKTSELNALMDQANSYANKSTDYLKQGLIAPSYDYAALAVDSAQAAYQQAKIIETYTTGGIKLAINNLMSGRSSVLKASAMLDRLKSESPRSLSDVNALTDAFGYYSIAVGLNQLGDKAVERSKKSEKEALEDLIQATLYYSWASYVLDIAEDALDIGLGLGTKKVPSKKRVRRISEALRRAAEANIDYFDNVVLGAKARSQGLSLDIYKEVAKEIDFDYAFATSSMEALPLLKEKLGPGEARSYATLGNSLQSFALSSGLIAKYYSLGAKMDDSGNIVSVDNEKALINMLDIAEKKAVENINLAKKMKAQPGLSIYYYEAAKVDREGNIQDKFFALDEFWRASIQGRILAMLSGVKIVGPGAQSETTE